MVCCVRSESKAALKVGTPLLYWAALWLLHTSLSACVPSDEAMVREATHKFWQSILVGDLEAAKRQSTWDSTQYLKLLADQPLNAQRFEVGELLIKDGVAEVATLLYREGSAAEVPVRTVLVRYEQGWLVDVQKTLGSMVSGTMQSIVGQLNSFMQDGLNNLDDALSQHLDELGKSLQQGLDELQQEFEKLPDSVTPKPKAGQSQQAI